LIKPASAKESSITCGRLTEKFAMAPATVLSNEDSYFILYHYDRASRIDIEYSVEENGLVLVITSNPLLASEWEATEASKYVDLPFQVRSLELLQHLAITW